MNKDKFFSIIPRKGRIVLRLLSFLIFVCFIVSIFFMFYFLFDKRNNYFFILIFLFFWGLSFLFSYLYEEEFYSYLCKYKDEIFMECNKNK